nr:CP19k-like protein 2 [Tetraclita japonica formosana]
MSVRLLLVCVAVATAVPLPSGKLEPPTTKAPPTKPPTLPYCDDLKTISKLKQAGFTKGGAAVSSSSSTQGSASVKCIVRTPKSQTKLNAAGNSGVSGAGVSASGGIYKQGVEAATEVKTSNEGVEVKTESQGTGGSAGGAAINQNAGANGGAKLNIVGVDLLKNGKLGLAVIKRVLKGGTTSSSGHKGSGSEDSVFKVANQGGTKIVFDKLTPPTLPPTKPAPTTQAPKLKHLKLH